MLFYIVHTGSGEFHITPMDSWDKPQDDLEALLPGLPLEFAYRLLREIKVPGKQTGKNAVLKALRKYPGLSAQNYRWENVSLKHDKSSPLKEGDFCRRSEGRQLSEVDLQKLGNESGLTLSEVFELSEKQVRDGRAEWLPAVRREGKGWQCMRCGETRVEEWPSIYGVAATCPSCAAIGALSSLQALYRSRGQLELEEAKPITFSPRWELSPAQKQASQEILDFVSRTTEKDILLWAACGAGKTEVCFPAAASALKQGQRVLFAAPRQDVVLDVAPRLERDFPGLNLSILTGISLERFTQANFVLATTHQVLRFYQAFDLIFLDEMDAFPYHGNAALAWGLQQALKPSGKIIYLTATPSTESLEKIRQGKMQVIRLPARHHRRPLPVPEWIKYSGDFNQENSRKTEIEHKVLIDRIMELAKAGPIILFVPKISWVNPWVEILRKAFPQWKIEGSYSSDPQRREKIAGLRNKSFHIFISTSILERGVTLSDVQVIVLAADHEIFDERALVQMAGRVGRTQENPGGRALFLAKKKTPGTEKAIQWIEEQNELAHKQGLID